MSDYISRADAIEAIKKYNFKIPPYMEEVSEGFITKLRDAMKTDLIGDIQSLPSAEKPQPRVETSDLISRADAIAYIERVINSGLGRNKSLDYIHKHISALPSADAEPKWNCTANFVAEQLERLRNMTDEERWDFFIKFFRPSADAVEVVRCEDCKHHEKFLFDDSKVLCWVHDTDIVVSPTDYCSYGERREDDEA